MIQDLKVNKELKEMSEKIWNYIGNGKDMPKLESKQGGSSGKYYPSEHTIRVRSNVWNKLCLGGKRMLLIHELWHSKGLDHKGLFMTSFDLLSIELYKQIYGEDENFKKMVDDIKKEIEDCGVNQK